MLGKIKKIEEVYNLKINSIPKLNGSNGVNLGMAQMFSALCGYASMDGYKIETDKHIFYVLIDNMQSCCENWGYFSSEDDLNLFIDSNLIEVNLTDTALNKKKFEEHQVSTYCDAIQFVDFVTSNGVFQIAVYNDHNGYYGHGILIVKDDEIILDDTL